MLSIVCVQTGNYLGRGAEYVHNLHRMVRENVTVPHEFCVSTDDYATNYPGMRVIKSTHKGWWEKLRLFRKGLFEDRVMFLDLDTIILRNIDHIAAYDGPFATLQDFWRPKDGLGPAVILWKPEFASTIYDEWSAEGFPTEGNGDQTWIENLDQGRFRKSIDILQKLYPGEFVSYKEHCTNAKRGWRGDLNDQVPPPGSASIVCFHGLPRPHQCKGWVNDYWKEAA